MNNQDSMYLCNRDLTMKESPRRVCFVNGKEYKALSTTPLTFIDEEGDKHEVTDAWEKHFKEVK